MKKNNQNSQRNTRVEDCASSNSTTNKYRVIGLTRVSTTLQSEENGGTGIQFQTEKIRQYANFNDFDYIKTISDVASGGLETRQGIEELKTHIENREIDAVLIWNVSRCFRSMRHFSNFYEYLKQHNVELISCGEGLRSSQKTGQLMFGVLISVAEHEKSIIAERLHSGRITKVANGVRGYGSTLPFGYYKTTNGEIKVDSEKADIVKFIFKKINRLTRNGNITKSKITRNLIKSLENKGYTYNGKRFKGWNIRDIVKNVWYIGVMKYGEVVSNHNHQTFISKRLFNKVACIY